MKPAIRWSALLLLVLDLIPLSGHASGVPLWEAGLGVAFIDFPDYRGSDERNTYVLPIPYVVYRGKFLKVDREKVRGLLLKSDKAELDVSLNGFVGYVFQPRLNLDVRALSKRFPDFWVGGFVKWDNLRGATFEDSPLVKSTRTFTAGFAVSWIFAKSKNHVPEEF